MIAKPTIAFVLLLATNASASGVVKIEPIGAHYPIFIVEKNENPQNILVAYTQLNSKCEVVVDPVTHAPTLDYYWLMNRKDYKPVHRMIKSGIRDRLSGDAAVGSDPRSFQIHMNDLKELDQDLQSPTLVVTAKAISGKTGACDISGVIELGPSDKSAKLRLDAIYTESKTTLIPPFRKVVAVTLIGNNFGSKKSADKEPFRRKYLAR